MKKHIKQTLPAILIGLAMVLASCNSGQKSPKSESQSEGILLRYNPKLNETVTIKTVIEQNMSVMGQEGTTTITMMMDMTATEKTDSLVTVVSQMTEMSLNSNIMGQNISFDSKHMEDADPTLASNLNETLQKTFEIVYDIYGNVIQMPEDYPNKDQGFAAVFPKEKVCVGSQWNIENDNTINNLPMHSSATYTVKEITETTTEIEIEGKITSEVVEGDLTGTMTIENETGIPITAEMNMPTKFIMDSSSSMIQTITITKE